MTPPVTNLCKMQRQSAVSIQHIQKILADLLKDERDMLVEVPVQNFPEPLIIPFFDIVLVRIDKSEPEVHKIIFYPVNCFFGLVRFCDWHPLFDVTQSHECR